MNRTYTNDRLARTRDGRADAGRGGSGYGSQAPRRTGGPVRSGGHGRWPATLQGKFALPRTITPALPAVEGFAHLDMPEQLLAELGRQGVTAPYPIQGATLPLAGRDVPGRGRTGSGKTLAFGLALLARTAGQRAELRRPLGLILIPTRELARQVTDALTPYARSVRLRLATVVGGMSIGRQAGALRGGAEIVVATPGRLKDLIDRAECRLNPSAGAVTTTGRHVLHVHGADKRAATTEIAARDGRVIMFLDTKHAVDRLTVRAAALHGGKSLPGKEGAHGLAAGGPAGFRRDAREAGDCGPAEAPGASVQVRRPHARHMPARIVNGDLDGVGVRSQVQCAAAPAGAQSMGDELGHDQDHSVRRVRGHGRLLQT
ncbi:DEAD/DEAH box helicase [Streptomyces longwoodensis]|uniref:DEAD/DEAH box helicase n=1 Tax=Streptomyces longwoodensis TaxID=68231 RepID=UPI000B1CFF95|nr:DEAD/DEAH box helicase [Streptomyces longwoodensis]